MEYEELKEKYLQLEAEEKAITEEIDAVVFKNKEIISKLRADFVNAVNAVNATGEDSVRGKEQRLTDLRKEINSLHDKIETFRSKCPHRDENGILTLVWVKDSKEKCEITCTMCGAYNWMM